MNIFTDTHAHLYGKKFKNDLPETVERARGAGIARIFMPNIDRTSVEDMLETERLFPENCFPMIGLHPCSVKKDFEKELYEAENWLNQHRFAGIGETGLDLYWDKTFLEQQKEALRIQAGWAKKLGLPLIIHSREAMPEVLELLENVADEKLTGVLHCFTGTLADAHRLTAIHFKLGIGGVATYKNAGMEPVLSEIDLEHFVFETDSPYLAPVPHRGKRNEPAYTLFPAQKTAEVRGISLEKVSRQSEINARELFSGYLGEKLL